MSHTTQAELGATVSGHKFLLLFLFLLASLLLYPYAETARSSYYALRVLGSAVILFSVYAISVKRSILILALLLSLPALFRHLMMPKTNPGTLTILNIVLSFIFDVLIVVVLFRRVFTRHDANSETVFGALCIYLLVGFSFAGLYGILSAFTPNTFYLDPHTNFHTTPDRFDCIYYSFAAMTSLGSPGITAVSNEARSLTILETILGILYLAVLIARLMSAYRPGPAR